MSENEKAANEGAAQARAAMDRLFKEAEKAAEMAEKGVGLEGLKKSMINRFYHPYGKYGL